MLTLHQTKICYFLHPRGPIIETNRYSVTKDKHNFKPPLPHNLVPRVLSYPPYARPPYFLSLLRVGENPGNEVAYHIADSTRKPVSAYHAKGVINYSFHAAHIVHVHSPLPSQNITENIYKYTLFGFSCPDFVFSMRRTQT